MTITQNHINQVTMFLWSSHVLISDLNAPSNQSLYLVFIWNLSKVPLFLDFIRNCKKIFPKSVKTQDFAKNIYCYFHGAIVKGCLQKGLFTATIARFLFHSIQPPIAYYSSIQHCSQITEIF